MTNKMLLPRNNAIFDKQLKERSIGHNLIYADAARNMTSNLPLERSETCTIEFRNEIFSELKELTLQKYYTFQRRVLAIEQGKRRMEIKRKLHADRIQQSLPFIEENHDRYRRTVDYIKHDAKVTRMKSTELATINKEISELRKKKLFYEEATGKLKKYETFLVDTLNILPHDYVKGLKENNMTALLRRYTSLFFMNQLLYDNLDRSSSQIRELMTEVDLCYYKLSGLQSHQSVVFPSLNNRFVDTENELSMRSTEYVDSYTRLRGKLHCFGVLLLAVNNVANKAFQILEKGFSCELELGLIPRILELDSDTKFTRIEEFISCALQILQLVESKRASLA